MAPAEIRNTDQIIVTGTACHLQGAAIVQRTEDLAAATMSLYTETLRSQPAELVGPAAPPTVLICGLPDRMACGSGRA